MLWSIRQMIQLLLVNWKILIFAVQIMPLAASNWFWPWNSKSFKILNLLLSNQKFQFWFDAGVGVPSDAALAGNGKNLRWCF